MNISLEEKIRKAIKDLEDLKKQYRQRINSNSLKKSNMAEWAKSVYDNADSMNHKIEIIDYYIDLAYAKLKRSISR